MGDKNDRAMFWSGGGGLTPIFIWKSWGAGLQENGETLQIFKGEGASSENVKC